MAVPRVVPYSFSSQTLLSFSYSRFTLSTLPISPFPLFPPSIFSPSASYTPFSQSILGQAVLPFRHHSEPPYPAHKAHIALFVRPRLCPQGHFSVPTSDFLQIPPRGGHPCLRLTVPTAKSVADFHRQVIAHVERTKRKASKTWCFQGFFESSDLF